MDRFGPICGFWSLQSQIRHGDRWVAPRGTSLCCCQINLSTLLRCRDGLAEEIGRRDSMKRAVRLAIVLCVLMAPLVSIQAQ